MVFYETNVFDRDVDYTELPKAEKVAGEPRPGYVVMQAAKFLGSVALTGVLSLSVVPTAVASGRTTAILRELSTTSGSSIPTNPLPLAWRTKAERFSRLFVAVPETEFESDFDIDHDL